MPSAHFRANVVAIVGDGDGRVLAFERGDVRGQWQLPQGGVDVDEDPDDAAWRELKEETGLTAADVRLGGVHPDWTVYEWPEGVGARHKNGRLGQAQRWYFFEVLRPDVEPTPDGVEFVAWKWVDPRWLVDQVVDFRKPSYRRVLLG